MYQECPNGTTRYTTIGNALVPYTVPCGACPVCDANFAEEQAAEIAAENAAGVNDGYPAFTVRRFMED